MLSYRIIFIIAPVQTKAAFGPCVCGDVSPGCVPNLWKIPGITHGFDFVSIRITQLILHVGNTHTQNTWKDSYKYK